MFQVPTLGERSHEEAIEIASHLGELPLAPFPTLAHPGAAVVVFLMVVVITGGVSRLISPEKQPPRVREEDRRKRLCECVEV